mmetsp:Transcript_66648/g.174734  ORF Transcript_66648/g.174734 Transcript_66648/m.174734 type:complete len:558 (+) Transcript_66648:126-1799(+)
MGCTSSVTARSGNAAAPQPPSAAAAGEADRIVAPALLETNHSSGKTHVVTLPIGKGARQTDLGDDSAKEDKEAHAGSLTCNHASVVTTKSTPRANVSRKTQKSYTMPASTLAGRMYNGFKSLDEPPTLTCKEENIAPFTLPQEALSYEPHPDAVITSWANGDSERKIHCNLPLQERELERLAMLRGEARAEGVEFSPTVIAMATRFLSRSRMDPKKALKLMKATQEWRNAFFKDGPVSDDSVVEDMRHGIVYFTGRDHALRPAIVIRAIRIPQQWYKEKRIDKFIRVLIFCMEYFLRYMVIPGKVENLSVIVDLKGLSLSQVPLGALREVYNIMSHHYIGRVFRFYVCNMSSTLGAIAGMAKAILTDRQKQKLMMLDDVSELRKDFALHQLEKDLGGSREPFETFFPFHVVSGPFEAGYDGEPDTSGVPDAHKVLTALGSIGRLWEAKKTEDENTKLDYSAEAADVLLRCGLAVPPELILHREVSDSVMKAAEMASADYNAKLIGTTEDTTESDCCSTSSAGGDFTPPEMNDELDMGYTTVQDASMCSLSGIFFCRA